MNSEIINIWSAIFCNVVGGKIISWQGSEFSQHIMKMLYITLESQDFVMFTFLFFWHFLIIKSFSKRYQAIPMYSNNTRQFRVYLILTPIYHPQIYICWSFQNKSINLINQLLGMIIYKTYELHTFLSWLK